MEQAFSASHSGSCEIWIVLDCVESLLFFRQADKEHTHAREALTSEKMTAILTGYDKRVRAGTEGMIYTCMIKI